MTGCEWGGPCPDPAAYELDTESCGPLLLCVAHTAVMREHDPLQYIVGVRSLPRELEGAL